MKLRKTKQRWKERKRRIKVIRKPYCFWVDVHNRDLEAFAVVFQSYSVCVYTIYSVYIIYIFISFTTCIPVGHIRCANRCGSSPAVMQNKQ